MLQQHKKQTNIGVGLGFASQIGSKLIEKNFPSLQILALLLLIASLAFTIWGCAHYAKGKGYSGYWGALGIFWLLGFVILALFKDKHKNAS